MKGYIKGGFDVMILYLKFMLKDVNNFKSIDDENVLQEYIEIVKDIHDALNMILVNPYNTFGYVKFINCMIDYFSFYYEPMVSYYGFDNEIEIFDNLISDIYRINLLIISLNQENLKYSIDLNKIEEYDEFVVKANEFINNTFELIKKYNT